MRGEEGDTQTARCSIHCYSEVTLNLKEMKSTPIDTRFVTHHTYISGYIHSFTFHPPFHPASRKPVRDPHNRLIIDTTYPPKIYIFVNLHSSLASAQKEFEQRTKSISRFTHILTHHKTKIVNSRRGAPREGLTSSDQSQACKRSKVSPNRVIGHGFEI